MVVRKMKEKCKDAARRRREKERAEFVELSKLLPLPSSTTNQLDKASIIRLTSSYLRIRSAFPRGLGEDWGEHKAKAQEHQKQLQFSSNRLSLGQIYQAKQSNLADCTSQQLASSYCTQSETQAIQAQQQIRELGSLILQTLDGFVFALHRDGKVMYISETASVHLGLPQIDLSGSSIFEYTHQADHNDLNAVLSLSEADREHLNAKLAEQNQKGLAQNTGSGCKSHLQHFELGRSFCMRMKCILPKRNAGLVSNGYKAIHCSGYLKVRRCLKRQVATSADRNAPIRGTKLRQINQRTNSQSQNGAILDQSEDEEGEFDWECYALVAVGHSLLPTASTEIKLNSSSFMFRANLDLKLYYIESPITKVLGYQQSDLVGQSLYQFVHVADVKQLEEVHRMLLRKGQAISRYFRLMRQTGGYIWLQIHATLVNNPRSMPKPQHVVSICTIIDSNNVQYQDNECQSACLIVESNDGLSLGGHQNKEQQQQDLGGQQIVAMQMRSTKKNTKQTNKNAIIGFHSGDGKRKASGLRKGKNIKQSGFKASLTSCSSNQSTLEHSRVPAANQYYNDVTTASTNLSACASAQGFLPINVKINDDQIDNATSIELLRNNHQVNSNYHQTIGSLRRISEDSCSVVSSAMSTFSACSNTSSSSVVSMNHDLLPQHQHQQQTPYYQPLEVITTLDDGRLSMIPKSEVKLACDYGTEAQANNNANVIAGRSEFVPTQSNPYSLYNPKGWTKESQPSARYDLAFFVAGSNNIQADQTADQFQPDISQQHSYYQIMDETPFEYHHNETYLAANELASSSFNHQHYQQHQYHQHNYQHSNLEQGHMIQYNQQACSMDVVSQ